MIKLFSRSAVLLFILSCFFCPQFYANQSDSVQSISIKQYLSTDKIFIRENSIEVDINGELIPVTGLFVDSSGVYTTISISENVRVPPGLWECPRCHLLNSMFTTKCAWCDWKPGEGIEK